MQTLHQVGKTFVMEKGGYYYIYDNHIEGTPRCFYLAIPKEKRWALYNRCGDFICNDDQHRTLHLLMELADRHERLLEAMIKEYGDEDRLCPVCGIAPRFCFCTREAE